MKPTISVEIITLDGGYQETDWQLIMPETETEPAKVYPFGQPEKFVPRILGLDDDAFLDAVKQRAFADTGEVLINLPDAERLEILAAVIIDLLGGETEVRSAPEWQYGS